MEMDRHCKKFLKDVACRIRELRHKQGWTLEETEDHGWPSWQHLQKIESGKNITLATLWKIAHLYDVSPNEILEGLS